MTRYNNLLLQTPPQYRHRGLSWSSTRRYWPSHCSSLQFSKISSSYCWLRLLGRDAMTLASLHWWCTYMSWALLIVKATHWGTYIRCCWSWIKRIWGSQRSDFCHIRASKVISSDATDQNPVNFCLEERVALGERLAGRALWGFRTQFGGSFKRSDCYQLYFKKVSSPTRW